MLAQLQGLARVRCPLGAAPANHELPPPPLLQAIEALFGGHLPTAADLSDGAKRQNIHRFTGYDMEVGDPPS